jgi:hypothetical protein
LVGVARRSKAYGGRGDRHGQQSAGRAVAQESDSCALDLLVFVEMFMALIVHPAMTSQ